MNANIMPEERTKSDQRTSLAEPAFRMWAVKERVDVPGYESYIPTNISDQSCLLKNSNKFILFS